MKKPKSRIDWEARWIKYEKMWREYEALGKELRRLKGLLSHAPPRPPLFGPQRNPAWEWYFDMQRAGYRKTWESLSATEYEAKRGRILMDWRVQETKRLITQEMQDKVATAVYRTMAAKLHPDHGGNHEDMVMLNEIFRRKSGPRL